MVGRINYLKREVDEVGWWGEPYCGIRGRRTYALSKPA